MVVIIARAPRRRLLSLRRRRVRDSRSVSRTRRLKSLAKKEFAFLWNVSTLAVGLTSPTWTISSDSASAIKEVASSPLDSKRANKETTPSRRDVLLLHVFTKMREAARSGKALSLSRAKERESEDPTTTNSDRNAVTYDDARFLVAFE